MQRGLVVVAILSGVPACSDGPCDPETETCSYSADVSTITVESGREDEDTCQSWTLNNPTELWVNSITQHNGGGYQDCCRYGAAEFDD